MAADALVDLDQGVLRLPRPVFQALVELLRHGPDRFAADAAKLQALRRLGLVAENGVDRGVATLLDTVIRPVVELRVEFLGPARMADCPGWVDGDFAVLAVPGDDGVDDIRAADTLFLPARLASLLAVGARPRPAMPAPVPCRLEAFDELLARGAAAGDADVDAALEPSAPPAARAALLDLARQLRLRWRVSAVWRGPDGSPAGRVVEALDGGEAGWWAVQPGEAPPATILAPASGTALWRALTRLLPTDDELFAGSSG